MSTYSSVTEQLQAAAYEGDVVTLSILIKAGADVNYGGGSALNAACEQGHIGCVKHLVIAGAEVNPENVYTPLMMACFQDQLEVAKYLIDKGAEIHDTLNSALIQACECGSFNIARHLIEEKNADLELGNPFAKASQAGNLALVELLWEKGVNLHASNDEAFKVAAKKGHQHISLFLFNLNPNWFTAVIERNDELLDNPYLCSLAGHYSLNEEYPTPDTQRKVRSL